MGSRRDKLHSWNTYKTFISHLIKNSSFLWISVGQISAYPSREAGHLEYAAVFIVIPQRKHHNLHPFKIINARTQLLWKRSTRIQMETRLHKHKALSKIQITARYDLGFFLNFVTSVDNLHNIILLTRYTYNPYTRI